MSRRSLGLSLALLLCPLTARAGDPPAHAEAARKATADVLAPALPYYNGVGAPLVNKALSAGRPGQFRLLENAGAATVNEPDSWSCISNSQPPKLKQANIEALGSGVGVLDSLQTLATDASACNYNHFVSNPAAPGPLTSADRAATVARAWRKQLLTDIADAAARRKTIHYCNSGTWTEYLRRTYNTIHYLQDAACEHHQVGNAYCNPTDVVPQWQIDDQYRFSSGASCLNWITDKVVQSLPDVAKIKCDVEVVGPTGDVFKSGIPRQLVDLCLNNSIQTVCMGLERLLWHHCDLSAFAPGMAKTIQCQGPRSDHCGGNNPYYCEGELCAGPPGGQDFIAAAKPPSFNELSAAAADWAEVCKEPDDPCEPDQCQAWCERAIPAPGMAKVDGYCVNMLPGTGCVLHECWCRSSAAGQGCGGEGEPACKDTGCRTGLNYDPRTNLCTAECGKAGQVCCKKYPECGPGDTAGWGCQRLSCDQGDGQICYHM